MPGLSKLQREALDRLHPQGWTVALWTSPKTPVSPDDTFLGGSDGMFGGAHMVVNGAHILLSRRGRFVGFYAWGGRSIPVAGGRRPWSRIVNCAEASGCYGDHRVPRDIHLGERRKAA